MTALRKPSLKKQITPYILVIPVFIYCLVFWVQPVLQQVIRSFIDPATGQVVEKGGD